jgi:multidrug efflux pump subunit AcrA (membrane-fusion protein)
MSPVDSVRRDDSGLGIAGPVAKVVVGEQAQANLGISTKPWKSGTYWKTISVPGMIVDRPGLSDRGVTAPVAGEIVGIAHVPGNSVRPGEALFSIRVLSESLHQSQTELFKATQEIALAKAQKKRLADSGGAVPEVRMVEVDNQIARLEIAARAYRQELRNRGFSGEQVEGVAGGAFVREITVAVPKPPAALPSGEADYEVQELKVELGQQVQAGQALCTLSNHHFLAIEGRAFKDEIPLLERSVTEQWPVEVDFQGEPSEPWSATNQTFRIRHLANTIDPVSRTFAFRIPMENECRTVRVGDRPQVFWRFRPGQKVRLLVRTEEVRNVIVLPAEAVVREGSEAFAFVQNDDVFERIPVRVVLQNRHHVVLANDGSLAAGTFLVQTGAAQLNRMLKAGAAGGVPKGYHMHADGSLHKNDSEGN